jgi:hypothetical protein
VEATLDDDHVRLAGRVPGELHRCFGGFRARVREEERIDARRCDLRQARGELFGERAAVAVGLRVHDLRGLIADRGDDARMRVAGADDGDAGGEVEVLGAVGRAYRAARSGDDLEIGRPEPDVAEM